MTGYITAYHNVESYKCIGWYLKVFHGIACCAAMLSSETSLAAMVETTAVQSVQVSEQVSEQVPEQVPEQAGQR